jgi:hypothetical protein
MCETDVKLSIEQKVILALRDKNRSLKSGLGIRESKSQLLNVNFMLSLDKAKTTVKSK